MNFIQQDVNDHITPEIILKEEENHIVKVKIFNGHRKEVSKMEMEYRLYRYT